MLEESEAERLELVAEVHRLADELDVYSPSVRQELTKEPERAVRVLLWSFEHRASLKSPAGHAVARFRAGYDPATPIADETPAPLDLDELEAALERALDWGAPSVALGALQEAIARER